MGNNLMKLVLSEKLIACTWHSDWVELTAYETFNLHQLSFWGLYIVLQENKKEE